MKITHMTHDTIPSLSGSELNSSISWFLPQNSKSFMEVVHVAAHLTSGPLRFQLELEQNEEFLRESKAERDDLIWFLRVPGCSRVGNWGTLRIPGED